MKKWIFLSMAVFLTSLTAAGQDDMYFASSKKQQAKEAERRAELEKRYAKRQARLIAEREANQNTYYSGSNRNVDDYNRMGGSSYETLPADTGDIISFSAVEGVYPDSVSDFQLTQQMTRFDDYVPSVAYWEGYSAGQRDAWGWHSPWYYSSLYPWYDPWYYDPWYYSSWSWRYGWYDPWYYDYGWHHYGWYGGYYGYRPYVYVAGGTGRYYGNGNTGTLRRNGNYDRTSSGNRNRVSNYTSGSRFDGARQRAANGNSGRSGSGSTYGTSRTTGRDNSNTRTTTRNNTVNQRTTTVNTTPVRSNINTSTVGASRSSSTFGSSGSRGGSYSSGGSFGGGGSSRGGGSVGGGGGSRSGGRR